MSLTEYDSELLALFDNEVGPTAVDQMESTFNCTYFEFDFQAQETIDIDNSKITVGSSTSQNQTAAAGTVCCTSDNDYNFSTPTLPSASTSNLIGTSTPMTSCISQQPTAVAVDTTTTTSSCVDDPNNTRLAQQIGFGSTIAGVNDINSEMQFDFKSCDYKALENSVQHFWATCTKRNSNVDDSLKNYSGRPVRRRRSSRRKIDEECMSFVGRVPDEQRHLQGPNVFNPPVSYTCVFCPRGYYNTEYSYRHKVRHARKLLTCPFCNFISRSLDNLYRHARYFHRISKYLKQLMGYHWTHKE